jgi:hypothetical protein
MLLTSLPPQITLWTDWVIATLSIRIKCMRGWLSLCVIEDGDKSQHLKLTTRSVLSIWFIWWSMEQTPFLRFEVFMTVKMWTVVFWGVCSSETSVTTCKTTGCHNPEDHDPRLYPNVLSEDKANLGLMTRLAYLMVPLSRHPFMWRQEQSVIQTPYSGQCPKRVFLCREIFSGNQLCQYGNTYHACTTDWPERFHIITVKNLT